MWVLENFGAIAEAPGGIPKLRSLILDLAVRGKLVLQNPEDEPASKLLARIQANINKISRKKNSIQNISELPFDLPKTWKSVCLDQITSEVHYGLTASANFTNNQIKLLRITDIQNNSVDWSSVPGCDVELERAKKCRLANGDIVIARTGGTVGKSYLVESLQEEDFAVFASYLIRVIPSQDINSRYLKLVLESPIYWVQLSDSTTGTGQPNVNATSLKGFVLPLPPLAEQKRIVEKVDELMGLCDRYEAAKQTRDNLRQKLRESAIASLMNAETDEDLDTAWAFVRDNWHNLSQQPEDVDGLRQAVLQLATRGKIVAQNPSDKPAYTLLEAIRTERQILLKESKIQKPKKLPVIQSDELPFEIPKSWEWTRLGELCFQVSDGPHFSPNYVSKEEGIPFLSTRNIKADGVRLDSAKYISKEDYEEFCKRIKPEIGDILYTKGGTTGIATVNNLDIEFTVWVHVAVLKIAKSFIYPHYLAHVLNGPHCYGLSQKYTHGSSNKDLGLTRMILITIPLPPLAEQKRIVAKVDELMQLCDQLEASLRQSQQRAESLAASAISHLTI